MMIIQARQTKLQNNLNILEFQNACIPPLIVIGGVGKLYMLIFT